MAGGQRNRILIPQARQALDQLRNEVARELGIQIPAHGYMGDMPSRLTGAMGGHMVRRMIAAAQQSLASGTGSFTGTTTQTNFAPIQSTQQNLPFQQQQQWQ